MTARCAVHATLAFGRASIQTDQVRGGSRFIQENQPAWIKLLLPPALTLGLNVGTVLLLSVQAFF